MKTKKQYQTENITAAILFIIGFAIIIYCRIDGMSLTEGEIFVAYWPGWMSAIVCLSITLGILTAPDINRFPEMKRVPEISESKTLVYSPKDRTIECNGVVYDFYCGDDIDEQAILLSDLAFGHTTLQDAWIRAAKLNGGPL